MHKYKKRLLRFFYSGHVFHVFLTSFILFPRVLF